MYQLNQSLRVVLLLSCSSSLVASAAGVAASEPWNSKAIPELDPHDVHGDNVPELMAISKNRRHQSHENRRSLSNDYQYESHFVDTDGNEYDPYSLAWRYLGIYMDCGDQNYQNEGEGADGDRERELSGDEDSCQRKLLWAAYHDPRYKGGTIGEYQFYDISTRQWDASTCTTGRCAKMDCHEPHTHYKLVGVYKEPDGMYDWTEQ